MDGGLIAWYNVIINPIYLLDRIWKSDMEYGNKRKG